MVNGYMRFIVRLACLVAGLLVGVGAPAIGQNVQPQLPFAQLVDLWGRQLDRIVYRASQSDVRAVEIEPLRDRANDVRDAARAIAQSARNDIEENTKLLAPYQTKPGADQPPESDEVKAQRQRITDRIRISDDQRRQCEMIVVRAEQALERLTKLRSELVLQNLLQRNLSPLNGLTWARAGPQLVSAIDKISRGFKDWRASGLGTLTTRQGTALPPLVLWASAALLLAWGGHRLRRRYGRAATEALGSNRDRRLVAIVDGLGRVLVPILAVWLVGRLAMVSEPPAPLDLLMPALAEVVIWMLLVHGWTAAALAPNHPQWRVLPFAEDGARFLSRALRRLVTVGLITDFLYLCLTQSGDYDAVASIGALIPSVAVALLALPALSNQAWEAPRPDGATHAVLIGGPWWTAVRVALRLVLLLAVVLAVLGYSTLATRVHSALASTGLLLAVALLAHRLLGDLLEDMAAADTATGAWLRRLLGMPADIVLRGQHFVLLGIDVVMVLALCIALPAVWNADIDAILRGFGQLLHGVKIGGVTLSLADIAMALVAFGVCLLGARLLRVVVRDRVMPTLDAPLPLRQSVDTGLNYVGVTVAVLVGVGALGLDFRSLAIVIGGLSVGIGLGLQNIANNVISGVVLLVERPIKAGDWVSVTGHEGFVRRINIRATEIETFQRTHVIVPNSLFLQNPVINRTYSDTSSRIDIPISVPVGTDVARVETILRETALGHPRILRVPTPIVRFGRIGPAGLEFELFVFVAQLEDRLVVNNDLNRAILGRLIGDRIIDPTALPEFKVRDLDKLAAALSMPHAAAPPEG